MFKQAIEAVSIGARPHLRYAQKNVSLIERCRGIDGIVIFDHALHG